MAKDVEAFLSKFKIQNYVLAGYCIGGRVAMEFSKGNKESMLGLIILESSLNSLKYDQLDEVLNFLDKIKSVTLGEAIILINRNYKNEDIKRWVLYQLKIRGQIEQEKV
jgi:pimeloyl-ACP methyl ester carboxylesterase